MNMGHHKLLVQMSGAPGSGKSTLANLLAGHSSINGVIINHDLVRSFFLDNGITSHRSAELSYNLQWVLAGDFLRQGLNVIVDSTCNHQQTLYQGTALTHLQKHGYGHAYVECVLSMADIGILEERLHKRVAMRSQRTRVDAGPRDFGAEGSSCGEGLSHFKAWIESPVRPARNQVIAVDATSSPKNCLDSALEKLGFLAAKLSSGTSSEHSTAGSM